MSIEKLQLDQPVEKAKMTDVVSPTGEAEDVAFFTPTGGDEYILLEMIARRC